MDFLVTTVNFALCKIYSTTQKPPVSLERKTQKAVKWPHNVSVYLYSCSYMELLLLIEREHRSWNKVHMLYSIYWVLPPTGCFWHLLTGGFWTLEVVIWLFKLRHFSKETKVFVSITPSFAYIYEYAVSMWEKRSGGVYEYLLWEKEH